MTAGELGFFDSGFGGLSVVREIRRQLPRHTFTYLGDNARTPYGSRSRDVIHRFTLEGVQALFDRGAQLIVLACNTSSSVALRRIQQEYLAATYPDRRVLGIVIPTAEEMSRLSRTKVVGVLATEATVASDAYPQEIFKVDPAIQVYQQACPALVPLIEAGELEAAERAAREYVSALVARHEHIDVILLGCTHYALIEEAIRRLAPSHARVVSQGSIVAGKLVDYLTRHPEMAERLDISGNETFLTTAYSDRIQRLGTLFYGSSITMGMVHLG
jgi:glutamate racemase